MYDIASVNQAIIGSDNGLSPNLCQAIIRNKFGFCILDPREQISVKLFFTQENDFENVICKMAAILTGPQLKV